MPATDATAIATALLYREAQLLDQRDWDGWLALYSETATYWVPAWRDEDTETSDPDREISQIYHASRQGLVERVMRVQSGKSVTANPLPRTTHFVSNIVAEATSAELVEAHATWQVLLFQPRSGKQHCNFGRYEVTLAANGDHWCIQRKKIHLNNDLVPTLIDFYTL